jgi:hypothetical protein
MTMRWLLIPLIGLVVVGGSMSLSACALSCSASEQKLASLRRGMTYVEASQVMGCPGTLVTANSPADSTFATVEWNGPDSLFFRHTQIDFQDGKLLSYTTGLRGAL